VRRRTALIGVGTMAWLLTSGSGCVSNDEATPLRPVSLPDVSRATGPVQEQLRERYASLRLKAENSTTSAVELGHEYGEMGKLLMASEYRDAAEPCFLNAQALMPSEIRWPYYLAHLYRLRNEPEKSAVFFETTLRLRPDDVPALVWLGGVYLVQGRPEPAEPLFTKALTLQPRLGAALFGLGRVALAKRDYARAVTHLEEALKQDPLASIVHYPLAMAYRGLGELGKAESHLRQRGHVDPVPPDPLMSELNGLLHSALAYERLGVKALDKKEWQAAAAYFRKGVELAPDNASVRHRLGTALFVNGDARGAMQQFEEVVRRSPDFAKARYSLGVLMIASGRENDAIEQLSAAVRYDPNYVEGRLRLAEVLRRSGRLEESLSQYEQVIAIDPRAAEARFGFAITLVRLRRYQEARDRLTEGMHVYPTQPAFARALSRLLAAAPDDRVRNGRQAMAMTQQLLEQQQTVDLAETMAMTLAELGQYRQAATLQREVMAAARKAGHQDVVKHMAENLARYERNEPCRMPLRADDPVEVFEPLR
jgi:tetratricopeptide (TPR) repeat protein